MATDAVDIHAERATAEPANWGLVGDLGEVRERIMEVLVSLSGHTAADIEESLAELADDMPTREPPPADRLEPEAPGPTENL